MQGTCVITYCIWILKSMTYCFSAVFYLRKNHNLFGKAKYLNYNFANHLDSFFFFFRIVWKKSQKKIASSTYSLPSQTTILFGFTKSFSLDVSPSFLSKSCKGLPWMSTFAVTLHSVIHLHSDLLPPLPILMAKIRLEKKNKFLRICYFAININDSSRMYFFFKFFSNLTKTFQFQSLSANYN